MKIRTGMMILLCTVLFQTMTVYALDGGINHIEETEFSSAMEDAADGYWEMRYSEVYEDYVNTYTDLSLGLSFGIPNDWEVTATNMEDTETEGICTDFIAKSLDETEALMLYSMMIDEGEDWEDAKLGFSIAELMGESSEKYKEEVKETFLEAFEMEDLADEIRDFEASTTESLTPDGRTWLELKMSVPAEDGPLEWLQVDICTVGEKAYYLMQTYYENDRDGLDQIRRSFSVETEPAYTSGDSDNGSPLEQENSGDDEYGLTGTYADEEENYWLQIVAEEDGSYTYKFYSADESEYNVERNCYIDGGFIYGEISSLTYNIDGTLSYSGDFTVENMEKISDDADINNDLTYDLYTDARDALLYYNYEENAVCDMNGDVIPEYDYITTDPEDNQLLINGEPSNEYSLTFYDRIIYSPDAYAMDENGNGDYDYVSGLNASWANCDTNVITSWHDDETPIMEDDGNYYDEIVLRAWYNDDGTPIAEGLPEDLSFAIYGVADIEIDRLNFVDNNYCTIDQIRRSDPYTNSIADVLEPSYAFILTDIQKNTNWDGTEYFIGYDYFTGEAIAVNGNFNKILNGDKLMAIGFYQGMASDDTINIAGRYVEIINNRF